MAKESVASLRGVGPKLLEALQHVGIRTISDLLFHLPFRYEDRTRVVPIGSLYPGSQALVEGEVEHASIIRGRRPTLTVIVGDGTGLITLRFFHFRHALQQQLCRGTRLRCFGEARGGYKGMEMVHPSYQRIAADGQAPVSDRLTPVYPSTEGLGQHSWIRLTDQALDLLASGALELEELLPADLLHHPGLPPLADALRYIHRPPVGADVTALIERRHPCQQRLALEELLAHNLGMQQLHLRQQRQKAPSLQQASSLETQFIAALPFQLTRAQRRVITEIHADLALTHPMQRLLQGDVGCGKTVVAAMAALRAIGNQYQTAIMAPTELLAEQHLRSFQLWFEPLGIKPVWLSSKIKGKARGKALEAISAGSPLIIGTHAVMQEGVNFGRLGLAIVDEQHRFGVHQRLALFDKGKAAEAFPHQLIMTATPIPRTLAMTLYADLDISVIDELPPGRKPVNTAIVPTTKRDEVIDRIARACTDGRQAYWVCTLIEESESLQCEAATETSLYLAQRLPQLRTGLIHGRLKPAAKDSIMTAFKRGEIDLLVATTVIEVGVDVPNASLMIIENAERLGLFQLHQLRGRIGRGARQSDCVLMYQAPLSETAKIRLDTLRNTTNGFEIAQKDLELRGPGEMLGTRQTGLPVMRIADLMRDAKLLPDVHKAAALLQGQFPDVIQPLIERWLGDHFDYGKV